MKIFISWSGTRSKVVAELLRDWIRCVLQAARPWVSTRDLDRGSLWFGEINEQLKDTTVGIICLTQENKERPWILFEAGALTKGLSSARVCPILIDLETKDVGDPLAQFNLTRPDKEGFRSLVVTLNNCAGQNGLDSRILDTVFETYWPQFETGLRNVLKTIPLTVEAKPRKESDILADILEHTRSLSVRMARIEESGYRGTHSPEIAPGTKDEARIIISGGTGAKRNKAFDDMQSIFIENRISRFKVKKEQYNISVTIDSSDFSNTIINQCNEIAINYKLDCDYDF